MFFLRKKVDAAVAEATAQFARTAEETQQQLAAAEKISGAGERYLALVEIENKIQTFVETANNKIETTHRKVGAVLCCGGAVVAIGLAGPMIFVLGTAGSIGSMIASSMVTAGVFSGGCAIVPIGKIIMHSGTSAEDVKYTKKFNEVKNDFCTSMNLLSQKITTQKTAIVDNELAALAASPQYNKLYDNFPEVKNAFTRAAARESIQPPIVRLDKPSYPRKQG